MKKHITIFTGHGIANESSIPTFRTDTEIWNDYVISKVATKGVFDHNREESFKFYNELRKFIRDCEPNIAHKALVKLEKKFNVDIITQNIDDLHTRAGSSNILYLHGEITKIRSEKKSNHIIDINYRELKPTETNSKNHLLRPHVVLFGESVMNYNKAKKIIKKTDLVLIIGTSLNVHPVSNLIYQKPKDSKIIMVDLDYESSNKDIIMFNGYATELVPEIIDSLIKCN